MVSTSKDKLHRLKPSILFVMELSLHKASYETPFRKEFEEDSGPLAERR